jgi:AAA15 family ATPase/GTPase
MSEQHIKDLEIRNFKCFKHLNIANIRQVNLIGGKNNVGKTAFLEAVELFVSSDKAYDLASSAYKLLLKRQKNNSSGYLEIDFINDKNSPLIISSLSKTCTIEDSVGVTKPKSLSDLVMPKRILELSINRNNKIDKREIPINIFSNKEDMDDVLKNWKQNKNLIYISSSISNEKDIAISYGALIELGMEYFLNKSLHLFDKNISELKQIATEHGIVLKLKTPKNLILLSSLGEGINRYIAILCAIWASKDGTLLIDEIENGIHYTNYKKLWQIIFKASVDANCQIFITTHSKECITAFNDVQFEDESCNTQYFEFYKNLKTDLIAATARDKEQLRYALTHEGRIRGE